MANQDHAHRTHGVSVVMSVYQDAVATVNTIHSVFAQFKEAVNQTIAFEFIIIDDGAEQAVKQELTHLATHYPNLIIHSQANQGLTQALITGCELAQYAYIARIDAGDLMVEGRLAKQINILDIHPERVLVSTWTRYQTREGYFLYEVKDSSAAINQSLALEPQASYVSPQHFTVMFRKQIYDAVGGYRANFYFAQDFDLWLRLVEHGQAYVIPESLTISEYTVNAISGAYSQEQAELLQLAVESARLRRLGKADTSILQRVRQIRPKKQANSANARAKSLYFIAACLLKNHQNHAARNYFIRCIKISPFKLMAYIGFIRSFF